MKYKNDFKKTRIIILLPLIPAAAAMVLGIITDNVVFGYMFVAAALVFALLHVALWRCPECRHYMGRGLSISADGRCPMCQKLIAEPVPSGEKAAAGEQAELPAGPEEID